MPSRSTLVSATLKCKRTYVMHSCVVGTVAFGTGLCRQTTNKNLDKQRAKVAQNVLELIFSTNSTVSVVMADRPAAGIRCHGRVLRAQRACALVVERCGRLDRYYSPSEAYLCEDAW